MSIDQVGSFRTRTTGDGSLEVWARGWRLESPLYALIPVGLALGFVLAPMPMPLRAGGVVVMLAAGLFVFRLQKPGLLFAQDAVTIVGVVRTRRIPWELVSGFMGERRHDEGRVLLVMDGDEHVALPGTLDPSELDPYGEEGEMLSAVDQLNRLGERARAGQLPKASPLAAAPKQQRKLATPKLPKRTARDRAGSAPDDAATGFAAALPQPAPEIDLPEIDLPEIDLMEPPMPPRTNGARALVVKAPPPLEDAGPPTRKQRRAERKELRKALKAVRFTKDGRAIVPGAASQRDDAPDAETPGRRLRRRPPTETLTEVPIAEPAGEATRPPRRQPQPPAAMPSYYPQPTYIPQEEYARMLREQRAAEKAAAAAAAELSQLADADDLDEASLDGGWSG